MLILGSLFSKNAVLQREKNICVWGTCDGDGKVTVSIQGHSASADIKDGKWRAELPPLEASQSEVLTASCGGETVTVQDIAVGEVWIAGGQSNMEFPMRNLKEFKSLAATNEPMIRLFGVPRISYEEHLEDDDFSEYGFWRTCTPENLWFYSAAPFYFALKLYKKYGVPVGIVNCNYGGTRAMAWAERSKIENSPAKIWLDEYEKSIEGLNFEEYAAKFKNNPMLKVANQDHSDMRDKMWKGYSDFEMIFVKRKLRKFFEKMPIPFVGPLDPNSPSALYENMVKKIAPYGARGVIWYQGESDEAHADVYDAAMGAVVDSWRELWDDELPFLMVQLAPYYGWMGMVAKDYDVLREKQEILSKTKKDVYITNVMDAGMKNDIHPKKKKPVGERLALLALGRVYGEDIVCEAPEVKSFKAEGGKVTIAFANCGTGLKKTKRDIDAWDITADGAAVEKAKVKAAGDTLTLAAKAFEGAEYIAVKYGRKNYCECNIKSSADIPVKPFEFAIEKK